MIHITEEQVRAALPMNKAIELVEESFRRLASGRAVNHARRRVVLESRTVLHYMAAGDNDGGFLGAKVYATNPATGAHFLVLLFDAATAELLATIDANALGQIRTGAASGVATRVLATPAAATLTLIGSGFQAETQLEAVAAVRPLRKVWVYSRSEENRERFASRMAERLSLAIEAARSLEGPIRESDIVTTITNARQPLFAGEWLRPGCHINAAGSNHAKRREIDAATVERATLVAADSVEQAKVEAGDLIAAAQEGRLEWGRVKEFSDIVSGRSPGRTSPEQITLFESQGLALEDIAVAGHVYRQVSGRMTR